MGALASPERPGLLRRAAAGAWHVPAGFAFLLRNPALWPLAILPALLAGVLTVTGLVSGWYLLPRVEAVLVPSPQRVGDVLSLAASVVMGLVTVATSSMLGFGLALILTAPLLDLLSQRTQRRVEGVTVAEGRGLRFELAQSLKGAFFFAAAVPVAFAISLIPFAGPPLATLWGAYALAFQLTDGPLSRRGLGFGEKQAWHRYWRAESLGFGLVGLLTLVVPFANLLMAPALTVGATRLVLELGLASGLKPVGQQERAPRQV